MARGQQPSAPQPAETYTMQDATYIIQHAPCTMQRTYSRPPSKHRPLHCPLVIIIRPCLSLAATAAAGCSGLNARHRAAAACAHGSGCCCRRRRHASASAAQTTRGNPKRTAVETACLSTAQHSTTAQTACHRGQDGRAATRALCRITLRPYCAPLRSTPLRLGSAAVASAPVLRRSYRCAAVGRRLVDHFQNSRIECVNRAQLRLPGALGARAVCAERMCERQRRRRRLAACVSADRAVRVRLHRSALPFVCLFPCAVPPAVTSAFATLTSSAYLHTRRHRSCC